MDVSYKKKGQVTKYPIQEQQVSDKLKMMMKTSNISNYRKA